MVNVTARFKMADIEIDDPTWTVYMALVVDGVDYTVGCPNRISPLDHVWEVDVHDGSWYYMMLWAEYYHNTSGKWWEIVELPDLAEDDMPRVVRKVYHDYIRSPFWQGVPWYFDFAALEIPPIVGKVGIRNMPV